MRFGLFLLDVTIWSMVNEVTKLDVKPGVLELEAIQIIHLYFKN